MRIGGADDIGTTFIRTFGFVHFQVWIIVEVILGGLSKHCQSRPNVGKLTSTGFEV